MIKWDIRYLDLAFHISQWSKDPSTKTGAVIVRPNKSICSVGFNGFPRGVYDDPALLENRDEKYKRVIHAEVNALTFSEENVKGYTMYIYPFLSCERCCVQIIQSGIKRVVAPIAPKELLQRWGDSFNIARDMYEQAGVVVEEIEY